MLSGQWRPLLGLSLLSIIIITIISLLTSKGGGARPRLTRSRTDKFQECESSDIVFCSPANDSSVVLLPYSALHSYGFSGGEAYDYYALIGSGWYWLIGETGYDWSGETVADQARILRRSFKMTKTATSLVFTFNTTTKVCHTLTVYQYVTGRDPKCQITLCYDPNQQVPTTSQSAQGVGGEIIMLNGVNHISPVDELFHATTGISGNSNNWLLMAEQAADATDSSCVVCLGARPLLKIVPSPLNSSCLLDVMNKSVLNDTHCAEWGAIYPQVKVAAVKPIFSTDVAPGNFTCVNITSTGSRIGTLNTSLCSETVNVSVGFSPVPRADVWWWCGEDKIYDTLPHKVTGHCALVSLLLPVNIYPVLAENLMQYFDTILPSDWKGRSKRSVNNPWLHANDPTYIDAIGVPRGVPEEYKLVDQVAAGFESSICWWCTINKNVDRINYVHYNVQRLGNQTEEGFRAVHEQLEATSLMTFQNRIAVDMLLAEKGGVCSIFGSQCCTFIPNNTAPDGRLTRAIEGLRTLNKKMKDHSGVDTSMWDNWMKVFGRYKTLISSTLTSLAVFASILTLCGCCCIPCLRSLANRVIITAVEGKPPPPQMMPLLTAPQIDSDDEKEEETKFSIYLV